MSNDNIVIVSIKSCNNGTDYNRTILASKTLVTPL